MKNLRHDYCLKHLGKIVFRTENEAHDFMRVYHHDKKYQIYPCPSKQEHFHIRDRIKRNNRRSTRRRKEEEI